MKEQEQMKELEGDILVYKPVYLATAKKVGELGIQTNSPAFLSFPRAERCGECESIVPPLVCEVGQAIEPQHYHEENNERISAYSSLDRAINHIRGVGVLDGFVAVLEAFGKVLEKYYDDYANDGFGASSRRHNYVDLEKASVKGMQAISAGDDLEEGYLIEDDRMPGFLLPVTYRQLGGNLGMAFAHFRISKTGMISYDTDYKGSHF